MAPNTGKTDSSNGQENVTRKKPVVSRDYLQKRSKGDTWRSLEHIIWPNVAYFAVLHLGTLYGIYLACNSAKIMTILFAILLYHVSLLGTACAHRLWAHQSYKAALPLRYILAACHSMTFTDQNSILVWARRHRLHHRYWATNADPVNVERGLFFAHCGWLMSEQHPDVDEYGGRLGDSAGQDAGDDLLSDPVVRNQHQNYIFSVLLMCFLLPTTIPVLFWAESAWTAYWLAVVARHTIVLNCLWLTNSVGYRFGARHYDVTIDPADNALVSWLTLGEGYQNFHYTFPWDYSASDGGWNCTTFALNQLAKIGWVTDRRAVNSEMIQRRRLRTGDKLRS